MPCCIDVVDTRCCDMPCREIQYVWRDVVQQLQRRLRVSGRIDVVDTYRCDLLWRHVQHGRSAVMQQLQLSSRLQL